MRIGIIGAGALGSVLGGLLTEAGVDTILVERDSDEVSRMREQGLRLEGITGDRTIKVEIFNTPEEAGTVDLVLVIVKSYDTAGAINSVKKLLNPNGVVLTLQNGVGNFEILNEYFSGRVLLGITTIGAMTVAKGVFRHTGKGPIHFGEADGTVRERTRQVADVLKRMNAGDVEITTNAMGSVWSKVIINAAINAPGTLLRVRNGDLPSTQEGRKLISEVVQECKKIIDAKAIQLIFDDPEARVLAVCEGTAPNLNSMLQDVIAGRRTEIDFINGALAVEGEKLGVETPVNRTLTLLIKMLEGTAGSRV